MPRSESRDSCPRDPHNCDHILLALTCVCSYTCPQLPPHPTPTNVRQLRPNDFSLVMAIGASQHHIVITCLASTTLCALRPRFLSFATMSISRFCAEV